MINLVILLSHIFFKFSFAAEDNICSNYLKTANPIILSKTGEIVYSSASYTLEISRTGYKVNGHFRKWPEIHEMKGGLISQVITSTEASFITRSEFVFTKQTVAFNFLGQRIIDGYQFLFTKKSVLLGLPKGSVFVVHEILLQLDKDDEISDELLGNLINTLDAYVKN